LTSLFSSNQILGKSCCVEAAIEANQIAARKNKDQKLGEIIETHAGRILAPKLCADHVPTIKKFKIWVTIYG
jgi:hypothetical protein